MMDYPEHDFLISQRRIRQSPHIRSLARQVHVQVEKLIQPLFVVESLQQRESIPGLTDVYRDTSDSLIRQVESDLERGVKSFLLFGVPEAKSPHLAKTDFLARKIHSLKSRFGADIFLSVDVCLCSTTPHGHCGILNDSLDHVDNGSTVIALAEAARDYAQAGADCVAPSDMMDHRIQAIRDVLDHHKLDRTLIMSYSAKFHSAFYGPFRVAADSAPKGNLKLTDRATYQIDPAHPRDARVSSERDAVEGADILMVKPGLPYLDVLAELSKEIPLPWAVYEVSGEFASVELLAREGLMNRARGHVELWTGFMRAGASMIITYGARHARDWLKESE